MLKNAKMVPIDQSKEIKQFNMIHYLSSIFNSVIKNCLFVYLPILIFFYTCLFVYLPIYFSILVYILMYLCIYFTNLFIDLLSIYIYIFFKFNLI